MSLKFIAISGTTGVTENLYVYEFGQDMVVVDCGVGFPESEMYGVDFVIPDFTYIKENSNKLRAILITHGHEDHIGALPYLLKEVRAPVYSTRLVAGFIEERLVDSGIKDQKVNVFDPEKDVLSFGMFNITPFRISHSVPDAVGFSIDTPEGKVFHIADYKFDWTPVNKEPFDVSKLAVLASQGVLAVASDCLGATTSGYTESEYAIEKRIKSIAQDARGQFFFTTISSNISRIQQAINVALSMGRKVALVGRSIESKVNIARRLGYLHYPGNLIVKAKEVGRLPKERRMFVISGSYGQVGSALYRVALGEHDFLSVGTGDVVIFSSDPAPPGSKENVDFVVDRLIEANADVHYYDIQEDLHVSGHGSQEDIKMLFGILKPKYFIPIGGTIRHMRAYKDLAITMGNDKTRIFEPLPGDVIEFSVGVARKTGKLPVKEVLVDGLGIGDVGQVVLRDRQILAKDGAAVILIQVDKMGNRLVADPEIISRGFVFQGKEKGFLVEAARELRRQIEKKKRIDKRSVRDVTIDFLERFFFKETGRRPMILPVIVEV